MGGGAFRSIRSRPGFAKRGLAGLKPFLLMMLSVFLFSIYPVLAAKGLALNDPIPFLFATHLACAAFSFLCGFAALKKKYGGKKIKGGALPPDGRTWGCVAATGAVAALNHTCLMYAFLKIPMTGATIIYEVWPILAAWLMPLLVVKGWKQVRRLDYVFGLLAIAGIAFIMGAENPDIILALDLSALRAMDPDRLTGYGLAFAASIGVAVSTTLRRNVTRAIKERHGGDLLLATYLSSGLTRAAALPVFIVLYFVLPHGGGKGFAPETLPLACFTGIAVHLMGSVCYVLSILKSPNPAIPVPDFLAPVMAVAWLCLFGYSGITDFAIIGGLFVITANLLVTVRAEEGFAYTASILTLLLSGTYCYFTTGEELGDFYDAISVSAVFYAILIAFAWDRVLNRTKHEEQLTLNIAYGIEGLRRKAKGKSAPLEALARETGAIMTTSDRDIIRAAYARILAAREKLGAEAETLRVFQDLDSLILSKTRDILLSEVVLLCLIGGVTLIGILGYRPAGMWPDMMGFIMAGAIVYIFCAILDQVEERNRRLLAGAPENPCVINGAFFESRHEFKLVTIALIAIMLAVFYGLFRYKYL